MEYVQINPFSYANIVTATTTVVKSGRGTLGSITFNGASAGITTVYDNTAGSGTNIATIPAGAVGTYTYNVRVGAGITIVTAVADNLTVAFN